MGSAQWWKPYYKPQTKATQPVPRTNPLANSDRAQATEQQQQERQWKYTPYQSAEQAVRQATQRVPSYAANAASAQPATAEPRVKQPGPGPVNMVITPRRFDTPMPGFAYQPQSALEVLQQRVKNIANTGVPRYQFTDPMSVVSYVNAQKPIYAPLATDRFGQTIPGTLQEVKPLRKFNYYDTYGGKFPAGYSEPPLYVVPGNGEARGMHFADPRVTPPVADRSYDTVERVRENRGTPTTTPWTAVPQVQAQGGGGGGGYPYPGGGGGGGGGGGYSQQASPWWYGLVNWRL